MRTVGIRNSYNASCLRWLIVVLLTVLPYFCNAAEHKLKHVASVWVSGMLVSIRGFPYESVVRLDWKSDNKQHTQQMRLPGEYWLWQDENKSSYVPSALPWKYEQENYLIIIGGLTSGAYGQRIPLIYKIQRGKWHLVADSDFVSFTNRGGFNLSGKWLRMWDYEGAENKAHSVAQRYWLRVFTIEFIPISTLVPMDLA